VYSDTSGVEMERSEYLLGVPGPRTCSKDVTRAPDPLGPFFSFSELNGLNNYSNYEPYFHTHTLSGKNNPTKILSHLDR
jgi:hypothetical protein